MHLPNLQTFSRMLEEYDLIGDFRNCCDAIAEGRIEFTATCSYRTYKTFFSVFYQVFGPFAAKVSFTEDFPPEDCAYNTTVEFEVGGNGNFVFVLLNVLSFSKNPELSEECDRRKHTSSFPFEANCKKEGHISEWLRETTGQQDGK
jgi:hypothetical protein